MAEDSDLERTEPASPRRIEQAREKGQIARSRELNTFAVLLAGGGALLLMGEELIGKLTGVMRQGLTLNRSDALDSFVMLERLRLFTTDTLIAFLPFLLVLVIAALASSVLMSGWLFSVKALQPDFGRLNPLKGVARIFSSTGLVELAKAVAKSALIGGVGVWFISHNLDVMLGLITESVDQGLGHLGKLVGHTFFVIAGSMILIVAIDVPFQLWNHAKQLRMTKEELRQEHKESEGDPQIKARIRQQQREAARRRMMTEVPKADVIVTNPTRYAVALRYQDKGMRAPQVVAKGSYLLAERIRELGHEHGVPILQAPPLARALYRHGDLGGEIPAALYTAVAEVLAYVYHLREYQSKGGAAPTLPSALPVPAHLDPEAQAS
jgi:flagellar biosynthetic protein FlhB